VIVSCNHEHGRLRFFFEYEENEPKVSSSEMVKQDFFIELPSGMELDDIHPDHLALTAFLVVRPWIKKNLVFPKPISQRFADAFKHFNYSIGPVGDSISPYESKSGKYMALAFSGGADSTAALSVLPSTTIPIFLNRPDSEKKTLYDKRAALASCEQLRKIGYRCLTVLCDLESLRKPVGFPTDLSNGVPAILMANWLNIYGIAYGTVFESLFGLGRLHYKDYEVTSHKKMWWNVFDAAGLPLTFPVGGISEVGTELICSKSKIGSIARSCIRGSSEEACYRCWKCFRKSTLRTSLGLEEVHSERLHQLISTNEVQLKLSKLPISHEVVLLYAFSRLDMQNYPREFTPRFQHAFELSYLERWFGPSSAYIDQRVRDEVVSKISFFLQQMDSSDERLAREWNNEKRISNMEALTYSITHDAP